MVINYHIPLSQDSDPPATSNAATKPAKPPPFPTRRKYRRRNKKRRGFGVKQVGSNKSGAAAAGATDEVEYSTSSIGSSSECSDREDIKVEVEVEVKGEDGSSSQRLRSASTSGCVAAEGSGFVVSEAGKGQTKRRKLDALLHQVSLHSRAGGSPATTTTRKRKTLSMSAVDEDFKLEPDISPSSALAGSPAPLGRPKKKKRIPYTLVEASKGNHCPTEGCEGRGHITGMYAMHFAVSGCPKAHGKTAEECKARREELNRLRSKNMPQEGAGSESVVVGDVVLGERTLRRTQRSCVEDLVSGRGNPTSLSITRKMQAQVRRLSLELS